MEPVYTISSPGAFSSGKLKTGGQMGCYFKLHTGWFLAKLKSWAWKRKGNWGYTSAVFKNCSRTGNSKVPNNILLLSLMFRVAERLLYFDIFEEIFNKFQDNFVFAYSFPDKLSLYTVNWPFNHPALWIIQNIYYLKCVDPSFLEYEFWNALKVVFFYFPWGQFVDLLCSFNSAENRKWCEL